MNIPKILQNLDEYINSNYVFAFVDKYGERTRKFNIVRKQGWDGCASIYVMPFFSKGGKNDKPGMILSYGIDEDNGEKDTRNEIESIKHNLIKHAQATGINYLV